MQLDHKGNPGLAPVVLFVYNRPWHTRQTLEALAKNELASESILYVFADGPKENAPQEEIDRMREVEEIVKSRKWCKEVFFVKRKKNLGLADSIIDGVTDIVNKQGKIIVLEDDIVTSAGFLKFMNDALTTYESDERVMHISGYMFPVQARLPSTFFYNTASCWGWATWSRAWRHFRNDSKFLLEAIESQKGVARFDIENSYPFSVRLHDNIAGMKKTWAVNWYASFFLQNGYALHPYPSLVNNIGHDGLGENCVVSSVFDWTTLATQVEVKRTEVAENVTARRAMQSFNLKIRNEPKKKHLVTLKKLFVKMAPRKLLHLYKKATSERYRKRSSVGHEIGKLNELPRFQAGTTTILGSEARFTDGPSFLFMYHEIFESEIYKFETDSPRPYIIDAGANIGLSIIYFKKLFPNAQIVGFEPDKTIFKVLEENLASFGLADVQVINKAVWHEETSLKFFSEGSDAGRLDVDGAHHGLILVGTASLRPYLIGKRVDFLKIDIEGAETIVLQDCKDLLGNVERMFVEYHSFVDKEQSLDVVLKILKDAGFRCYVSHIGVVSPHPFCKLNHYMGMDNQINIFATRN